MFQVHYISGSGEAATMLATCHITWIGISFNHWGGGVLIEVSELLKPEAYIYLTLDYLAGVSVPQCQEHLAN